MLCTECVLHIVMFCVRCMCVVWMVVLDPMSMVYAVCALCDVVWVIWVLCVRFVLLWGCVDGPSVVCALCVNGVYCECVFTCVL